MKNTLYFNLFAVGFCMLSANLNAQVFTNADGVAINGYDPVAYFTQNEAVRGNVGNSVKINGVTWYFSSGENKAQFEKSPDQYMPKYGGYCAFAMAMKNATVPTDPRTFKLHDGQLYLFFNDYYEGTPFNTIVPWNMDEKSLIGKADENWKGHAKG